MSRFLSYSLLIFIAVGKYAYASVDMQCVNNCTSKGYQYQLCAQRCSYDMGAGQAPQPQINTTIPMQGNRGQIDSNIPLRGMQPVPQVQPMGTIDLNGGQQESQQSVPQVQQLQQGAANQQSTPIQSITGWENAHVYENFTLYINTASIVRTGNTARMWILIDHKATMIANSGDTYLSEVVQNEFDCVNRQYRDYSSFMRTGHMGGGYTIPSRVAQLTMTPIGTSNILNLILDKACKNESDHRR